VRRVKEGRKKRRGERKGQEGGEELDFAQKNPQLRLIEVDHRYH
jgi:hypothetical protein